MNKHDSESRQPTIAGAAVTIPEVKATIKLLDYYRRFLRSDCSRCRNPEGHWHYEEMSKDDVRARLGFLVNTAINRKAGIADSVWDCELWRDCQLVQHLVHRNRPSGLQWRRANMNKFRTTRIQKRYGHLLRHGE